MALRARVLRLLGVVLAGTLVLAAGCGRPAERAGSGGRPAAGDVAVYLNSSEVMVFWDPADSFSNEIIAMNNMYET
ncbi:MAG: hypothetical protein LOD90_04580, partial [Symbiobacteriaceae bacterium]